MASTLETWLRVNLCSIMTSMAVLEKLSVPQIAARLDKPFSMMDVALVGDIIVSVYICEGTLDWHKHTDIDELFWVWEGTILLESEWGEARLQSGELAVVPKGVVHRSSSGLRATVLLLRCGLSPERKNGRRRLYTVAGEARLSHVNLLGAVQALDSPFRFQTAASIEDSAVQVARGDGTWQVEVPARCDLLLSVLDGTATVHTPESMVHLHPGDLTVVPQEAMYQLSTTKDTALVRLIGGE